MEILYITRKFPPSIGGMQTQANGFYNYLREKEKIHIIAWKHSQKFLPFFILVAVIGGIYHNLRHKIDLIQVWDIVLSPLGLFLKIMTGRRVFSMAHGKDTSFSFPLYRAIVFRSAAKLDGVICVSDFLKDELSKAGISRDKLVSIPNGIDIYEYDREIGKEEAVRQVESYFGVEVRGRKIILAVSRMVKKKGIFEFVEKIFPEIVREFPNALLLLAGEPESSESREEKARVMEFSSREKLSENICFLGNIHDRSNLLKAVYAVSDVYVMPNVRVKGDFEGFGIVALEASMNRVPVVAFAVDGIPSAVADGKNGMLIAEGDNKAFASAVSELLRDEKARSGLGESARTYVSDHYSWERVVSNYMCVAQSLF